MGLKGQWWPLAHGGFCPRPSRARWEAVRPCNSSRKWGAGSGQPGRVQSILSTGAPFGLKFGSRFMLDRPSLLFISGACVLPVFFLTGFFVCFVVN